MPDYIVYDPANGRILKSLVSAPQPPAGTFIEVSRAEVENRDRYRKVSNGQVVPFTAAEKTKLLDDEQQATARAIAIRDSAINKLVALGFTAPEIKFLFRA